MKSIKMFSLFVLVSLILLLSKSAMAQDISTSVDIVSKYVWRGIESGSNAPAFQPTVKYTNGGFTFGLWGSTPISNPVDTAINEIDIFASYSYSFANSSSVSIGLTDYTYPSKPLNNRYGNFNNWNKPNGAHTVELNLGYTGTESLPIYVTANIYVYNVLYSGNYFEAGYTAKCKSTDLSVFAGATAGDKGNSYGIDNFGFINVGFKASKTVKITDSFSFPIFSQIILNPASEKLFYVVGISL